LSHQQAATQLRGEIRPVTKGDSAFLRPRFWKGMGLFQEGPAGPWVPSLVIWSSNEW
jgi:hypothetical protein